MRFYIFGTVINSDKDHKLLANLLQDRCATWETCSNSNVDECVESMQPRLSAYRFVNIILHYVRKAHSTTSCNTHLVITLTRYCNSYILTVAAVDGSNVILTEFAVLLNSSGVQYWVLSPYATLMNWYSHLRIGSDCRCSTTYNDFFF